jgi:hypothetical protein
LVPLLVVDPSRYVEKSSAGPAALNVVMKALLKPPLPKVIRIGFTVGKFVA